MIMKQGAAYCARISNWKVVDDFIKSGLSETIITLTPSYEAKKECRSRDLPTDPIKVRLIRVELENEIEVLVTNLLDSQGTTFLRSYMPSGGQPKKITRN